ncbi:DUF559 domain-containing protein [Anaeromusa sp.]|uniref:DUF559 domain-containing protein n=1 Tax=Anaeromusa sp. TaxID=1872520 RepID=UPI00262A0B21|nr:DUF559 domain-containing protein [Anaeromusa sp.]MDD3157459.1 DUF559 domain-containing protein [Anaeromusa sp.]
MSELVESYLNKVKQFCNPLVPKTKQEQATRILDIALGSKSFIGGCGYKKGTMHENMFALIFPDLERQVVFGTGVNGSKEWLSRRFIVDFYDRKSNVIYEIDGKSHKKKLQVLKDALRDLFFKNLGIKTIRISNQEVENMAAKVISKNINNEVLYGKSVG